MGFNYYYVSDLEGLKVELSFYGGDRFKQLYSKYDIIFGDSECVKFVLDIIHSPPPGI
jgi:hypothetical protein